MSDQSIEITIPADHTKDKVKIEVNGCVGPSCKTLTQQIETALGADEQVELKDEFHRKAEVRNEQQSGRG